MKTALFLLAFACFPALALNGLFTGSWSILKSSSETDPRLPEQYSLYSLGTSFQVSSLVNIVARGGFGTGEPSEPPVATGLEYISDESGTVWLLEGGADATLPGMEMFFLRATAGAACVLLDYRELESDFVYRRTDHSWEPSFSMALGNRLDLKTLPLPHSLEFSLLYRRIGDYGSVGGEIALGI